MKILIGLGNPGEKYKDTRHNIGFTIIEEIAKTFAQSKWIGKLLRHFSICDARQGAVCQIARRSYPARGRHWGTLPHSKVQKRPKSSQVGIFQG